MKLRAAASPPSGSGEAAARIGGASVAAGAWLHLPVMFSPLLRHGGRDAIPVHHKEIS